MDRLRLKAEEGFSLIELLAVIAVIGILAAIAIPQFASYRRRGFDTDAKSAVKNLVTYQEAYFVDKATYSSAIADLKARGFKESANLTVPNPVGTATTFVVSATAQKGCSPGTGTWSFASATGLIVGTACD